MPKTYIYSYSINAAPMAAAANPPSTMFLTAAPLLGAFSALAVVLEPVVVGAALGAADAAELDPDCLDAVLATLEALFDEAVDALLAPLALDAEAAEVVLAPELAADADSTVLLELITNCGV